MAEFVFFGVEVEANQPATLFAPPESHILHLSCVALTDPINLEDTYTCFANGYAIACLNSTTLMHSVDLYFPPSKEVKFSVKFNSTSFPIKIHFTGYLQYIGAPDEEGETLMNEDVVSFSDEEIEERVIEEEIKPEPTKKRSLPEAEDPPKKKKKKQKEHPVRLQNGLEYRDVEVGKGKKLKNDKMIKMLYKVYDKSGKLIDETKKKPFAFRLGRGEVIKGVEQGLIGMHVGGKRRLVIPSKLAYNDGVILFNAEVVDME